MQTDTAIEQEIQASGLTAPRLTPDDLASNIVHVEYVKHVSQSRQVLRWAVLTTKNGFAVTGNPSVAVSPENDRAHIGEAVAFENAKNSLWPLMGYALKEQLFQAAQEPVESSIPPHQQRVIQEHADLTVKLEALSKFMDGQLFPSLDTKEQSNLHGQRVAMKAYAEILAIRIKGFGITA